MTETPQKSAKSQLKALSKFIAGGAFSACVAEAATLPFDTAKVNLQLSKRGSSGQKSFSGFVDFFRKTVRESGLKALWKGLSPGLYRQVFYAGIRLGTYDMAKEKVASFSGRRVRDGGRGCGVVEKTVAAFLTGTLAIIVAQPADLMKVRIQGELVSSGKSLRYQSGFFNALAKVIRSEGVLGLWNGLSANIMRNATINTAELVSYDVAKTFFVSRGIFDDGLLCHIISALSAGFAGTVVGSPLDVIKTRVLNSPTKRGLAQTASNILASEGFGAFYKGFSSNFIRIGSWNLVMFLVFERVKLVLQLQKC